MKILIELPTWLGDSLMTTPAIQNIIDSYESVQISLVGSSISIEALKNHPNVVETHVLEKKYFGLIRYAQKLEDFDLFISFRSSLRSKLLSIFVSSKKKYQFNKNKYTSGHQVVKYNNFVNKSLNINTIARALVLDSTKNIDGLSKKKLLGINPGASYGSAKRWYPEEFAEVAFALSRDYDILILGGPNEKDISEDIEKRLIEQGVTNYVNLASKTTITQVISKISSLDLFITADSGPMHVAAAFKIPTVAIFGPTKDSETSPWMNRKSAIVKRNLDCQPCMRRVCPLKHHNCMRHIKSVDVINAVKTLN